MNSGMVIAVIVAIISFTGLVAYAIDDVDTVATVTTPVVEQPAEDAGFFGALFAPFRWIYDGIAFLLNIFDFAPNIDPKLFALTIPPILALVAYIIYRLIRGGG